MTIQNDEHETDLPPINLERLSKAMLINVVESMALRFSDEVEAEPEELISDSYQHAKDNAPQFRFEVDRGHSGYKGEYKSLDDGLAYLKEYYESFPEEQLVVKLTPINR